MEPIQAPSKLYQSSIEAHLNRAHALEGGRHFLRRYALLAADTLY
jgi:hypothetical protein